MGGLLYEGVAAELRDLVKGMPPGGRLPSEADLMREHGATRGTLRAALQVLERENLVISRQGRGWYVQERDPLVWYASKPERNDDPVVTPNDSWARGIRDQGRVPSERIEVAVLEAAPDIASRLDLDGGYVIVRRRVRSVDGAIHNTADTYYPQSLVQGTPIALPGDIVPGVYRVLEELGRGWRTWRDEKRARAASVVESDLFGIAIGDPVMETIRTRFDHEERPVAVMVVVAPGTRSVDVYEGES